MEPVRSLPGVQGGMGVNERQAGGGKRQADAFRQAMQKEGEAGARRAAVPVVQAPVRPRLQPQPIEDRREGEARHVDVIA
jgi:hypothetical protein